VIAGCLKRSLRVMSRLIWFVVITHSTRTMDLGALPRDHAGAGHISRLVSVRFNAAEVGIGRLAITARAFWWQQAIRRK
jgi:hypothetical protein